MSLSTLLRTVNCVPRRFVERTLSVAVVEESLVYAESGQGFGRRGATFEMQCEVGDFAALSNSDSWRS
jgi:hypothetical protein